MLLVYSGLGLESACLCSGAEMGEQGCTVRVWKQLLLMLLFWLVWV